MKEVVTRAQFDEFKAATTDVLLASCEKYGTMLPVFLFQNVTGKRSHFIVPEFLMSNDMFKGIVGETVREKIKDLDIILVCFCVEAYALQLEPGEKPTKAPSKDDRSVEIIMLHFESSTYKHTTQFKVTRENNDENGKIILMEPYMDRDITDEPIGGNFAGFFED